MTEFFPSVSVAIGVYNGEATIAMCLESLLKQNYPRDKYEIIVVENGSTDNTTEIVSQYPVQLYHNPVRGIAPARNFGLARSTGEIYVTTDADCIADENWLRHLVQPYADPAVGAVCGMILAYTSKDRSLVEIFSDENAPLVNYMSGEHEFLPHLYTANASFRRELLNQIGGFNENMMTGEDVDASWRLQLETGTQVAYAEDAIIYHKHRTTIEALGRLYRHYGFGEIQLDLMYGHYKGYPRDLKFQLKRIVGQLLALPRYMVSWLLRRIRLWRGQATEYEALVPYLWLVVEWNNIVGKWHALRVTRFMRDAEALKQLNRNEMIEYLYGKKPR